MELNSLEVHTSTVTSSLSASVISFRLFNFRIDEFIIGIIAARKEFSGLSSNNPSLLVLHEALHA
jgi:hypothetical protein